MTPTSDIQHPNCIVSNLGYEGKMHILYKTGKQFFLKGRWCGTHLFEKRICVLVDAGDGGTVFFLDPRAKIYSEPDGALLYDGSTFDLDAHLKETK